jgi:hypothetical protein
MGAENATILCLFHFFPFFHQQQLHIARLFVWLDLIFLLTSTAASGDSSS